MKTKRLFFGAMIVILICSALGLATFAPQYIAKADPPPCSPSDPDSVENGGIDCEDHDNGSGNDEDCEDDNNGQGIPAHCRLTETPVSTATVISPTAITAVPTATTAVPTTEVSSTATATEVSSTPSATETLQQTATFTATSTNDSSPTVTETVTPSKPCYNGDREVPCGSETPSTPAKETPTEVTTTPTGTATAVSPSITPTKKVEENGKNGKKRSRPVTIACQSGDQILSDDAKDIYWFSTNLGTQANITSALGGINDHGSFDPENSCLRMVFGNRENWGSAPYLWIYDGSFHQILNDGKPVQGDMADWSSTDKIAFVMDGMIFTINPDGTDLKDTGLMGNNPDWSADGKNLAFSSLDGYMSVVETNSWTHVHDYIETPMTAPHVDPGQKFVCGGSEYCFDLRDNYSFASTTAWDDFEDLAFEPAGNTELIVHSKFMEIIGGNTFAGEWYNPDWYSSQKAEFIPIK